MELAKIRVSGAWALPVDVKPIPEGIIGGQVAFEYTDPMWDGLSKTVVFKGCVTKDVLNAGEVVTVPAEVVARAGAYLYVGVYGTDGEGNVAIPTLWADLGKVRAAADPSGDESTDPQLPVWAQLEERIEDLEENGTGTVDQEQVAQAVAEYMSENPIEKGATKEQAAQIQANTEAIEELRENASEGPAYLAQDTAPEDTSVLWVDTSDNDDGFQEAVNAALAQARESGEFDGADGADGYTPVKGIDYYNDEDKAELVNEVLAKLPEGNADKEWKKVAQIQTTEDVTYISVTEDMDGNPLSFDEAFVACASSRPADATSQGTFVLSARPEWRTSFNRWGLHSIPLNADVYAVIAHISIALDGFVRYETMRPYRVAATIADLTGWADWYFPAGQGAPCNNNYASILHYQHHTESDGTECLFNDIGKLCGITVGVDMATSIKMVAGTRLEVWVR